MSVICSVITALTFFIMPSPTVLYGPTLDPIVTLPAGYFVLQSSPDAPDGYISVTYDDLNGYVQKSAVTAVDYTPVNKYETTVTFRCDNDGQPVNLRSAPRKSAEILTVLESTASGRCYGHIDGDALIESVGTKWYYVASGDLRGYCYCAHVDVDVTPPNIIEKEPPPEEPSDPAVTEPSGDPPEMSVTTTIILIVALCIPVPFIMFYFFRKPKDEP